SWTARLIKQRGVGPPAQHADIHAAAGRAVQDVEHRPAAVGHLELRPQKRHGEPDAVSGRFDRLGDASERWATVHPAAHQISGPWWIAARLEEGQQEPLLRRSPRLLSVRRSTRSLRGDSRHRSAVSRADVSLYGRTGCLATAERHGEYARSWAVAGVRLPSP